MTLTFLAWIALYVFFAGLSFLRPVWGVALYIQTFYAFPPLWWWGRGTVGVRWSLLASLVLLASVLLKHGTLKMPHETPWSRLTGRFAILMGINYLFVHIFLAPRPEVSYEILELNLKFLLLFFVMRSAIRTPHDMRIVLLAIVIGASYHGYEVTINERGKIRGGRLEGIGAPGANSANGLSDLHVTTLPLIGAVALIGSRMDKVVAIVAAPFVVNVILLCNSRGAFLGAIASVIVLIIAAPARVRKKAIQGIVLGGIVTYMLLGDPDIVGRFMTTFADAEEMDGSASGRIVLWRLAREVIAAHPLGSGGDAFGSIYSGPMLQQLGWDSDGKAAHNGYLTDAVDWGIQGALLRLSLMFVAIHGVYKTMKYQASLSHACSAFLGTCILACYAALFVHNYFGTFIDKEWTYWFAVISVCYAGIYGPQTEQTAGNGSAIADWPKEKEEQVGRAIVGHLPHVAEPVTVGG